MVTESDGDAGPTRTGRPVVVASDVVGTHAGPFDTTIDPRRAMAFAAGIPDRSPAYYLLDEGGVPAVHPLFVVCLEWGALNAPGGGPLASLPPDAIARCVHASHDLRIHRSLRAGADVSLSTAVVASTERRGSARLLVRFDGVDRSGTPLWTTDMELAFRGVSLDGSARGEWAAEDSVALHSGGAPTELSIEVDHAAPHSYSACSGIWNPVHTDLTHARSVGLPGTILHGTQSAALALSSILALRNARASHVRRLRVRFGAPVAVPSTSVLRVSEPEAGAPDAAGFALVDESGQLALRDGVVFLKR